MEATGAHALTWVAAAPLWKGLSKQNSALRRPALLRFASDAFMEELLAQLEQEPEALAAWVATREAKDKPLKLFQPVHGHFHLVAASLVCQLPGLPDHAVDTTHEEKASFVVRRLSGKNELAWCSSAPPSRPLWTVVTNPEQLAAGEELLPLFPAQFAEAGKRRKLLFGLVPTSSRETYAAGAVNDPTLLPKLGTDGELYVIRCVYRKPRCRPSERTLLSDRSERFAIASYFDPDAPARDIRVVLPSAIDALRNLKKGLGFVVSDEVGERIKQAKNALKDLPSKYQPPTPELACPGPTTMSFSIPIVTLVAMIILMVVASVLNFVFSWLSWPIFGCFPLPSLPSSPPEPEEEPT